MLIAARTGSHCMAWHYSHPDQSFTRWDRAVKTKFIRWISDRRLAVVFDDVNTFHHYQNDILIYDPFGDNSDSSGDPKLTFSMNETQRYVECEGNALVLQSEVTSKVRIFLEPFDERFKDCDLDFPIGKCAFSNGVFVAMSERESGRMVIWNAATGRSPHMIELNDPRQVGRHGAEWLQAVEMVDQGKPIFAFCGAAGITFVDQYGHVNGLSSKNDRAWDPESPVKKYDKSGRFRFSICRGILANWELKVTWYDLP
jgi:hypothetical protein